jgi:Polyketide cyclase / dehydrase and lipid transport
MSTRFAMSFLAVTFALTGAAGAVEVKRQVEVKAAAAKVWSQVGGWCAIATWHPVIAKCEESQEGGKTHRTLTTKDGGVIKETLLSKSATAYSYQIDESPLPVENYKATLAVTSDKKHPDASYVVWSAKFKPKGKEADAKAAIDGVFKAGLDQIEKTVH